MQVKRFSPFETRVTGPTILARMRPVHLCQTKARAYRKKGIRA
jgi:hypothetical protein